MCHDPASRGRARRRRPGRSPARRSGGRGRPVRVRPPRPERRIAAAFALTAAAAVGFAAVYWTGGQTQLEGVLLAVAFAGLAFGLGAWSARLMPQGPFVEEHEPFGSSRRQRAAFAAEFEEDLQAISRRRFLGRALALAVGTLGAALLFPLRSLGPRPGRAQRPDRLPPRPPRGRRRRRPAGPGRPGGAAAACGAGRLVAARPGRPLQALRPRRLPGGTVRAGLESSLLPLPPVGVRPAGRGPADLRAGRPAAAPTPARDHPRGVRAGQR